MTEVDKQVQNSKEQSIISVIANTPLEDTPTQDQLAIQAGMSKPTLNKYLSVLKSRGIIETESVGKGRTLKYYLAKNLNFNFQNKNSFSPIDIYRENSYKARKKTTTVIKSKSVVTSNTTFKEILEKKKIKKSINSFIAMGGFSKKIAEKLKTFPAKLSKTGTLYFKIEGEWMLASKVENRFINKRYWKNGDQYKVSKNPNAVRVESNPVKGVSEFNINWGDIKPKYYGNRKDVDMSREELGIDWGSVEAIEPLKVWKYKLACAFHEKLQETPFKHITLYQMMSLFREFEEFGDWFGSKLIYLIKGFTGVTKKIYNAYKYIRACVWRGIRGDNGEEQMYIEFWEEARQLERNRAATEGYGEARREFHTLRVPRLRWSMSVKSEFEQHQSYRTVREFYRDLGLRFFADSKFRTVDTENRLATEGYGFDEDHEAFRAERNRWRNKLDNLLRLFMWDKPESFGDFNFFIPSVEGY